MPKQPPIHPPDSGLSLRVRLASAMAAWLRADGDDDAHALDLLPDDDVDSLGHLDTEDRAYLPPPSGAHRRDH